MLAWDRRCADALEVVGEAIEKQIDRHERRRAYTEWRQLIMTGPQLEGEALATVRHRGSNLQIIASAGSGKTEVVSQRVADLLDEGASPRSIVAFTFTERAAGELKNRIRLRVEGRLGHGARDLLGGLFVGTIHSYCFRLLQQHVPRYDAYDLSSTQFAAAQQRREEFWLYVVDQALTAPRVHPINDPASKVDQLDALRDRKCLLIAETRTSGDRSPSMTPRWLSCNSAPEGQAPQFGRLQAEPTGNDRRLWSRVHVAQAPHPADAIDVLLDVAARHGGEPAPLLDDDVHVVEACWRLLTEGLDDQSLSENRLAEVSAAEVVLDQRSWLRRPAEVFFRDSLSLAERFGTEVRSRLIDRPEGLWRALGAAGVRNLSDAVETRIASTSGLAEHELQPLQAVATALPEGPAGDSSGSPRS